MANFIHREGVYPISQTGKTPQANAVPPTKAGQIPVSRINPVTGQPEYFPQDDPLGGINPTTEAGKAIVVEADATTGALKFATADIVPKDDAIKALIDQTGIITIPSITQQSPNTLRISSFKAIFYDKATDTSTVIDVPQQDVVISGANSGNTANNVTYLELLPNGQYAQTNIRPTNLEVIEKQFMLEILHENGGPITSWRPLFTLYSNLQKQNRAVFETIGLNDKDFVFTFTRATGALKQEGTRARVIGYFITTSNPSGDYNVFSYPVANAITVDYFSFDPNERTNNINNFLRSYKWDNPATATSTAIANNHFGILALFASISGKYTIIASQKEYTSLSDAQSDRQLYLSKIVLPEDFGRNNVLVASIIVSGTVTANASTEFIIELSGELMFNGGGSVAPSGLPDPATAQAGDEVVVNPATNGYELKTTGIPDMRTLPAGQFVTTTGSGVGSTAIQANTINAGLLMGGMDNKIVSFTMNRSNRTITNINGDDNGISFSVTPPPYVKLSISAQYPVISTIDYSKKMSSLYGNGIIIDPSGTPANRIFPFKIQGYKIIYGGNTEDLPRGLSSSTDVFVIISYVILMNYSRLP